MPTLPNMGLDIPSLGADIGQWDDKLNTAITLIDLHDHTSGKGVRVPSAGLNINANLSFGGFAITSLGQASFSAVAALASGSKVLFVNSSDNELYWRTNGGTNVKLTNGASINTSLVGGIVGDYSSVSAEVAYEDANDRYTFKQQGTKPWARVTCGGLELIEFNTTETLYIRLNTPAALGSSYDITLATALPGSTQLVQISNTGQLSYSSSALNSLTLASGQTITLAGAAGRVLQTLQSETRSVHATLCSVAAGTVSPLGGSPGAQWAASTDAYFPIITNQHYRKITSIEIDSAASANSTTYSLHLADGSSGTFGAAIAGSTTTTDAEQAICTPSTPALISDGTTMWVRIQTAAATTRTLLTMIISYSMD